MSFVLSVCGGNFTVMMSDGRVSKAGDRRVAGEDYQKVFRLNEKVCLGMTGDPVAIYYTLNELQDCSLETMTMERIKRILINTLKGIPVNMLGVQIILSGSNKSGKFVTYFADSRKNFEETMHESSPDGGYIVTYSGSGLPEAGEIVDKHLPSDKVWESVGEIRGHMKACIEEVAGLDASVNSSVYDVMVMPEM